MKLLKREIIEQLKILNIKFNKKDNKKKLLNLLENSKLEEIVEEEVYEEDNWIFEDETDDEEVKEEIEVKTNIIVEEIIDEEIINQYNLQLFSVEDKKIKKNISQNDLQINYILERIKIVKDKLRLKAYQKQLEILRKK